MAYLVRRSGTRSIRLLLLPSLLGLTLRCTCAYKMTNPDYMTLDWGRNFLALVFASKMLDFAFVPQGRLKLGEKRLRAVGEPLLASEERGVRPEDKRNRKGLLARLPPWLGDALEVGLSIRDIGWDLGRDTYIPQVIGPQDRGPFLKTTAISLLWNILILDFCDAILKSVPGVNNTEGGSIFIPYLPTALRYAVSTLVNAMVGTYILNGMTAASNALAMLGVGVLGHPPSLWPPAFDKPWVSQSLRELWGKRWHQLLRRVFLIYGGYPGHWLAGDLGLFVGTFVASGMFHAIGLDNYDIRIVLFFSLQSVAILLENALRKITGKRVGGPVGRLWVYLDLFVFAQIMTDAWSLRGMLGAMLIPQHKRNFTRILLGPLFTRFTNFLEK